MIKEANQGKSKLLIFINKIRWLWTEMTINMSDLLFAAHLGQTFQSLFFLNLRLIQQLVVLLQNQNDFISNLVQDRVNFGTFSATR